jgi:ComF family protein
VGLAAVLDLVAPLRCAVCRAAGSLLCAPCRAILPRIRPPVCARCGRPTVHPVARCRDCAARRLAFAGAASALVLDDHVGRLLRAWKDRGLDAVAAIATEELLAALPPPRADALVAVPAARDRARWRGVDGPAALARDLGEAWGLPVLGGALVRARPRPQRGLSGPERRRNARRAFAARGTCPARVVLVDDVFTTGATADACARALRGAGARRVEVVTLARVVR